MGNLTSVRTAYDLIATDYSIDDWGLPVSREDLSRLRTVLSQEWFSTQSDSPMKDYLSGEIDRIDAKLLREEWLRD